MRAHFTRQSFPQSHHQLPPMMKSPHYRLLSFGLLLLAGAVFVAFLESRGTDGVLVPGLSRTSSVATRSSGREGESLFLSTAPAATGSKHLPSSVGASGASGGNIAGFRPRDSARPRPAGLHPAEVDQPDSGMPVENPDQPELASSVSARPLPFPAEFPLSNKQPWRANNSSAPGSLLSINNQIARVTAFQPIPGTKGVTLAVDVEDMTPDQPTFVEPTQVLETESNNPATPPDLSSPSDTPPSSNTVARSSGFTYEQQLFRTKWGWAAYDQVQKLLREETSD